MHTRSTHFWAGKCSLYCSCHVHSACIGYRHIHLTSFGNVIENATVFVHVDIRDFVAAGPSKGHVSLRIISLSCTSLPPSPHSSSSLFCLPLIPPSSPLPLSCSLSPSSLSLSPFSSPCSPSSLSPLPPLPCSVFPM